MVSVAAACVTPYGHQNHQKWPKQQRSRWRCRFTSIRQVAAPSICPIELSSPEPISFSCVIPCYYDPPYGRGSHKAMLRCVRLTVCLSPSLMILFRSPDGSRHYARVSASNASDRGQHGSQCPRPNAISERGKGWKRIASSRDILCDIIFLLNITSQYPVARCPSYS